MKRLLIAIALVNLFISAHSQEVSLETKSDIESQFLSDWEYFRMQKNPELSYEETHDERGGWKRPFLIPDKFYLDYYGSDLKYSNWGSPKGVFVDKQGGVNRFVNMGDSRIYLVEKKDGLLGLKEDLFTEEVLDSMQLNIYDSIFPYDNRFLATARRTGKFTFHSGNVIWGEWRDVGYIRQVDMVGYIRGVQFGVENVKYYSENFSANIRRLRPKYPDYEYTEAYLSQLSKSRLLIAAPRGKEDQLVEFIYYTNKPEKTGDTDINHYYEMRYILPTEIKSIKERRLEKRLLDEQERKMILNIENQLIFYVDFLIIEEPEVIIER